MNLTATIIKSLFKRKLATALFLSISIAAFATLGDGGKKGGLKNETVNKFSSKTFTLRSGYNYRGNNVLSYPSSSRFIMLNTVITYQKGNATYILPLKKKLFLEKIKFNPAPPKY